jgi:hypothetical protein
MEVMAATPWAGIVVVTNISEMKLSPELTNRNRWLEIENCGQFTIRVLFLKSANFGENST